VVRTEDTVLVVVVESVVVGDEGNTIKVDGVVTVIVAVMKGASDRRCARSRKLLFFNVSL
jgi:hypothetical protein